MREILFRAKRVDDNKWITGYIMQTRFPSWIALRKSEDDYYQKCGFLNNNRYWFTAIQMVENLNEIHEVIPDTVSQHTGLYVDDGTMIFEGDIIANKSWGNVPHKIVWNFKDKLCFYLVSPDEKLFTQLDCYSVRNCKILGNVFDNPELLEVKHLDEERICSFCLNKYKNCNCPTEVDYI